VDALVARSGTVALAAPQTKDTQRTGETKRQTHFIRCHDAASRAAAARCRIVESHV
jgi:hypothetical protein